MAQKVVSVGKLNWGMHSELLIIWVISEMPWGKKYCNSVPCRKVTLSEDELTILTKMLTKGSLGLTVRVIAVIRNKYIIFNYCWSAWAVFGPLQRCLGCPKALSFWLLIPAYPSGCTGFTYFILPRNFLGGEEGPGMFCWLLTRERAVGGKRVHVIPTFSFATFFAFRVR